MLKFENNRLVGNIDRHWINALAAERYEEHEKLLTGLNPKFVQKFVRLATDYQKAIVCNSPHLLSCRILAASKTDGKETIEVCWIVSSSPLDVRWCSAARFVWGNGELDIENIKQDEAAVIYSLTRDR